MQLIMSPPSPFARKARVVLRETGLIERVEEVQVSTSPLNSAAQVISANPLGKIPALIRADGPAIYDSRIITRYLNDMADTALYPERSLYEVLTLEATAEGIMEANVGMVYDVRYRGNDEASDWNEAQWGKASRAIAAINERWMSHLNGPVTAAHIAVSCALAYVDLRHDGRNWRAGNDALANWQAAFEARDAMQATQP